MRGSSKFFWSWTHLPPDPEPGELEVVLEVDTSVLDVTVAVLEVSVAVLDVSVDVSVAVLEVSVAVLDARVNAMVSRKNLFATRRYDVPSISKASIGLLTPMSMTSSKDSPFQAYNKFMGAMLSAWCPHTV